MNNGDVSLIEKISNFVESIRLDNSRAKTPSSTRKHTSRSRSPIRSMDTRWVERKRSRSPRARTSKQHQPDTDRVADQLLVQAEKLKARIEAPKGNFSDFLMPYDYEKLKS